MAQDEGLARIPIFILLERDQDAWLARQAGAERYVRKPIGSGELVTEALELIAR
jgi:CheY-like chemotaxis protein